MRIANLTKVAIFLGLLGTAVAYAAIGPTTTQRAATSQPAVTTQPTPPSAEQVLKGVLESHSQAQPLLPIEPGKPVKAISAQPANPVRENQESQDLLQDGHPLKRTGRLVYDGTWWTLVPEGSGQSADPERPIRLLPNRLLETMEATSVGGTHPLIFTVQGQVTEYRGMNYLMVLNVMIKRDQGNLSK